jgi:hypothetical protein
MRITVLKRFDIYTSQSQQGNAVIEMAIVLPIFFLILFSIVDFGLYFNKRNVAQSAAWNGAKDCNDTNGAASFTAGSPAGDTLATMDLLNDVIAPQPTCISPSVGGVNYWKVGITIDGDMLSPITSALGLYDFTVTGIATDTN